LATKRWVLLAGSVLAHIEVHEREALAFNALGQFRALLHQGRCQALIVGLDISFHLIPFHIQQDIDITKSFGRQSNRDRAGMASGESILQSFGHLTDDLVPII
jgi:hypothetical protein